MTDGTVKRHDRTSRVTKAVLGLSLVLSLWGTGLASTTNAQASANPDVTLSFAKPTKLEMKTAASATLCAVNAPAAGSEIYIQEQEGAGHVWRTVSSPLSLTGNQCTTLHVVTPPPGRWAYRARLWEGKQLLFVSAEKWLTVYGPVPFATWCGNVSGCHLFYGPGGPVQVGGNIDNFIDHLCGWTTAPFCGNVFSPHYPGSYTLDSRTSCRSLTMEMVALGAPGNATGGVITVEMLQHRLNEQLVTLNVPGDIVRAHFTLDGGPVTIDITNTGSSASSEFSLYLLSASADCWTSTGTLSANS